MKFWQKKHYDPTQVIDNRILWIGRDEENRRPDLVLEYARQNPKKDVHMVFGGERYKESMKKYHIPDNVRLQFALSQDEIFALMNSSKVYWSCSKFDTFAMPLTEAMAMGKIIVKPEHPCYGHLQGKHTFAGNEKNWFELVNMAAASSQKTSEENRIYAFETFSRSVMKQGYQNFFADWLK